jgi:A/G-specific adenine glycosylase
MKKAEALLPKLLINPNAFQHALLTWFDQYGRKELPWQQPVTPYRVWISEVMLQQTQVTTVIPYFNRFMARFPTVEHLANAPLDAVLQHWAGLGYYARARNLHQAANLIVQQGAFPQTLAELTALPGVGLSTAGAILSIAFQVAAPILDGNVRRVLARFAAIEGWTGETKITQQLWQLSRFYTPQQRVADYTQAIMDLGATVCTRTKPLCRLCPLVKNCLAYQQDKTAVLPTPKKTSQLPVKMVTLLALQHQHRFYLQQRPPVGIWGGLWSLPEFDSLEAARTWCSQQQWAIQQEKVFTCQRHTFSHYHLDYTPLLIQVDNLSHPVMEGKPNVWYNGEEIFTLALPAPINKLMQVFLSEENNGTTG